MPSSITIRLATPDDAARTVAIWDAIVSEQIYSAVDAPFSVDAERDYLRSMSAREAIFLAETTTQQVVGFQSLDQWTKLYHSMDHVGQLGTFVLRDWRGRGIGRQLASSTLPFARSAGYEKLVIYVRASNTDAQRFYTELGFSSCGRLVRQVKIAGVYDDEILMEMRL